MIEIERTIEALFDCNMNSSLINNNKKLQFIVAITIIIIMIVIMIMIMIMIIIVIVIVMIIVIILLIIRIRKTFPGVFDF